MGWEGIFSQAACTSPPGKYGTHLHFADSCNSNQSFFLEDLGLPAWEMLPLNRHEAAMQLSKH